MTMTYAELIEQELRLEKEKARLAKEKARFDQGLLLCGNCHSMPASASLSVAVGWIGCGPCITGEAASFDDEDLVLEKAPASEPQIKIIGLYADGGCILKNPSTVGGTWAWCAVDEQGNRVIERGGVVPATETRDITNNHMEHIAITLALEAMPAGWSGKVYSDSQLALGRIFKGWRTRNLPANVAKRSAAAVARLGKIETVLLQGHPTKADLACGIGAKRNLPVSIHNVYCDKRCTEEARKYLKEREAQCVSR